MKKLLCPLLTVLALILPGSAVLHAQITKIGYVDTARIFENYKAAQDAQKAFDRDVDTWNKDLADLKNDIASLKRELENQSLVLSDAKRREKETALARKQSEYQSRVDEIWGPKGRATMRNQELVTNVINKVKKVLDTMAQKDNYTLILDAASGHILYGIKSYDLTDKVLEQLNSEETTTGLAPAGH